VRRREASRVAVLAQLAWTAPSRDAAAACVARKPGCCRSLLRHAWQSEPIAVQGDECEPLQRCDEKERQRAEARPQPASSVAAASRVGAAAAVGCLRRRGCSCRASARGARQAASTTRRTAHKTHTARCARQAAAAALCRRPAARLLCLSLPQPLAAPRRHSSRRPALSHFEPRHELHSCRSPRLARPHVLARARALVSRTPQLRTLPLHPHASNTPQSRRRERIARPSAHFTKSHARRVT
jgi:hypothetical protein